MRLLSLTVRNLRGLPELYLQLDGHSTVIWGPNGAGKSCVVDAIDFLFTGRISRLMGEGTGGITLLRHGPHIDHGAESAVVTGTVQLEGISQTIEISRCMAQPDDLICPDEMRPYFATTRDLMRRGGVVLTRRDILRYVTAEAGKRADDIQQLLRLQDIDTVRSSLYRAGTQLKRDENTARRAIETAKADVNTTLGLARYSDKGLLEAVNESRKVLTGVPLDSVNANRLKEGLAPPITDRTDSTTVNVNLFTQTVQNVRREVASRATRTLMDHDQYLRAKIADLRENPSLLAELGRLDLTEHVSEFVEESTIECPVCGASWPEGELKAHLEAKIATARAAEVVRKGLLEAADAIAMPARTLLAGVNNITNDSRLAEAEITHEDFQVLDSWSESLTRLLEAVGNPVEQYIESGLLTDEVACLFAPDTLDGLLQRIQKAVQETLPTSTPEQTAWDKLTRLEANVRALEDRISDHQLANLSWKRSRTLLNEYEKARDAVLEDLYSQITDRFVEFYRTLHDHEAPHFGARLQPEGASLTFDVDFMGRGTHPPHALHSEGHQDSMGICLFLTLNKTLVEQNIGFIVLDDVMMSVDTGHRKDICRLLTDQFSGYQFVITTHDRTWAKQLKQERVVQANQVVEFTGWTVETGPNTHRQMELWETIQSYLDKDDVNGAAFRLRRGNEEFFEDVCNVLGAQVTYNSEMQWQLDDWLPAAMSQYKDLVQRARRAASSWDDNDNVEASDERESIRRQVYDRTYVEQWSVNTSVHYNNWENMSRDDFLPVVDAFRDLQSLFICSTCERLLEKLPRKEDLRSSNAPVVRLIGTCATNLQHHSSVVLPWSGRQGNSPTSLYKAGLPHLHAIAGLGKAPRTATATWQR